MQHERPLPTTNGDCMAALIEPPAGPDPQDQTRVNLAHLEAELQTLTSAVSLLRAEDTADYLPKAATSLVPVVDLKQRHKGTLKGNLGKVLDMLVVKEPGSSRTALLTLSQNGFAVAWDLDTGLKYEAVKVSVGHTMSLSSPPSGTLVCVGGLASSVDVFAIGDDLCAAMGTTYEPYQFKHQNRHEPVEESTEPRQAFWGLGDDEYSPSSAHNRDSDTSPTSKYSRSPIKKVKHRNFPTRYGLFNKPIPLYVDPETSQYRTTLVGHEGAVTTQSFLTEEILVTGSADTRAIVWDVAANREFSRHAGHTGTINSVAASPTGHTEFVTAGEDGKLLLWDTRSQSFCMSFESKDHTAMYKAMFHPEGKCLVASDCSAIGVYDLRTNCVLSYTHSPRFELTTFALSKSGRLAITGSEQGSWGVVDITKAQWLLQQKGHKDFISSVATVDDIVLTSSFDGTIKSWEIS